MLGKILWYFSRKFEIRSSKSETISKFECSNDQNYRILRFVLNIGAFDIRNCFEFRILKFGFAYAKQHVPVRASIKLFFTCLISG